MVGESMFSRLRLAATQDATPGGGLGRTGSRVLLAGALLAVAAGAGLLADALWVGQAEERGRAALRDETHAAAELLRVKTMDSLAMGMSALLGINEPLLKRAALGELPPDDPRALDRMRAARLLAGADDIYVLNRKGVVVAHDRSGSVSFTGDDYTFRPYWRQAMAGRVNVYAAVGTTTRTRGLYIAAPMRADDSPDGAVIGVVVIKARADFLDAELRAFGGHVLLLSPQGVVFAGTRPEWRYHLGGPADEARLAAIRALRQFGVELDTARPRTLPFDPGAGFAHFEGRRFALERASLDWADPAGTWTVLVLRDTQGWLPLRERLAVDLLAALLALLLGLYARQRRRSRARERRHRRELEERVDLRTRDLRESQDKLRNLVNNGILLGREHDRAKLLRSILLGAKELAHCAAGTMYLKTEQGSLSFAIRTNEETDLPVNEIALHDPATGAPNEQYVAVWVALHNRSVIIDDVYGETRFDLSGTKQFSEQSGFRTVSMLAVPLSPRDGEVLGVMQLLNALDPATGQVVPFDRDLLDFVEALAAQSAVAMENQYLIDAQRALVDAIIRLLAGAIDAKSPYTGGHCERVPELAIMLAEEACKAEEGPLAGFRFETEEEWREFRIGAWLHDCGKVTTPEYVVDKATKLETLYNRIHEVRMRFEVLLRDARIECLEAVAAGGDAGAAERRFEARRAQLVDDFAFVAECNLGGEFMAPERIERLARIAGQTWLRHFDDRLGLSHEELQRHGTTPAPPLPAPEALLADKPHHIVPRGESKALDPRYGFRLKVPEHLYNHGELYNLSVGRGTLTEEERFKINEHIIQTIVMLENMPFPKTMRRIPEYAGTHHETLAGTGYPRKLAGDELSIPARIMAIADIFEALTASDRPYKKAKTLSESVKILSFFVKDNHIDPDLFRLFLSSGVYRRYAAQYLRPEQIDAVDLSLYL